MRIRIAALVVFTLATACGDVGVSPEDDLAIGEATATVSGSISASDTLLAQAAFNSGGLFAVAELSFSPVHPRDSIRNQGIGSYLPLPYGILISLSTTGSLKAGTYTLTAGNASASLYDSLGVSGLVRNPADSLGSPVSAMLNADSGSVTIDLSNDARWTGTYAFSAKDETGRRVRISGRFNAPVVDRIVLGLATSPLPPSPSRARR